MLSGHTFASFVDAESLYAPGIEGGAMKHLLAAGLLGLALLAAGCTTPEESGSNDGSAMPEVSGQVEVVDPGVGTDTNETGVMNETNTTTTGTA